MKILTKKNYFLSNNTSLQLPLIESNNYLLPAEILIKKQKHIQLDCNLNKLQLNIPVTGLQTNSFFLSLKKNYKYHQFFSPILSKNLYKIYNYHILKFLTTQKKQNIVKIITLIPRDKLMFNNNKQPISILIGFNGMIFKLFKHELILKNYTNKKNWKNFIFKFITNQINIKIIDYNLNNQLNFNNLKFSRKQLYI